MIEINENNNQVPQPNNHEIPQQEPASNSKPKSKNTFLKNVLLTVTAGVVGSVLTLVAIPRVDFFENLYLNAIQDEAGGTNVQPNSKVAPIVTKTATRSTTNSLADIIETASKAIVGIVNIQQQNSYYSNNFRGGDIESGSGSGVVIKKTNDSTYIVTNNHVIEGAKTIEVSLYSGEKATAELVGADALSDLAVIKIASKYDVSAIDFGDSSILRPGDQVVAIGNPLGIEFQRTVTQGIVSAVNRSLDVSTSAGKWTMNVIQTDAAINPGNSGGALINSAGQVIGINSLKISENGVEGIGFAIPSNDLLPIVNEIIQNGKFDRPYLGVSLANLGEVPQNYVPKLPSDVKTGAIVMDIDPNSVSAKAGIEVQDVIVAINDQKVENSNDLRSYLYSKLKVGDKVTLKVYKKKNSKQLRLPYQAQAIKLISR